MDFSTKLNEALDALEKDILLEGRIREARKIVLSKHRIFEVVERGEPLNTIYSTLAQILGGDEPSALITKLAVSDLSSKGEQGPLAKYDVLKAVKDACAQMRDFALPRIARAENADLALRQKMSRIVSQECARWAGEDLLDMAQAVVAQLKQSKQADAQPGQAGGPQAGDPQAGA